MTRTARTMAIGAALVGLATAGLAAPAAAGVDPDLNKVSYWENQTGGHCQKYEFEDGHSYYKLGYPPEGKFWELLIIKAGQEVKEVWYPEVGKKYYPANHKDISFVIVCKDHKDGHES